jgi:hypothetical protein
VEGKDICLIPGHFSGRTWEDKDNFQDNRCPEEIRTSDLEYKPEAYCFLLLGQQHCGPGVDSASNRNEYQESSWGVKGGRCVRLTSLPPSISRLSRENVGISTSRNPMDLHGLYRDSFAFSCICHTKTSKKIKNLVSESYITLRFY